MFPTTQMYSGRGKVSVMGVVALILALAAASCGEDEPRTTSREPSSLTKGEFLKQGNAICAKGNDEINRRFERYSRKHLTGDGPIPSEHSYAKASARIVLPLVTNEVEEIRELGTPDGDGGRVEKILRAFEKGVEAGERDPTLIAGQGPYAFTEAHERAIDYGLVSCALG